MPGAVSGGISLVTRVSRYTDEFRGIWKRPPIDRPWVERKAPYFVRFLEHFRSFLPYVLEEDIETSVARFDQAGFLPRYWSEIFARKHAVEKRLERIRQRGGAFQDAFFLPGHHLSSQGRDLCDGLIGRWDPRQEVMWIDEVLEVKLNTPGKRSQLRKHLEWMKADGLTLGPSRLMTVRVAYEGY